MIASFASLLGTRLAAWALALFLAALDPFSFEYSPQTDAKGQAYVMIKANEALPPIEVEITGDGQTIRRTVKLRAGGSKKITWRQKSGSADYKLKIVAGDVMTDFNFTVSKAMAGGKVGKLQVMSGRDEIVKEHKVTYKTSFAIASYEYKVYNTDGVVIAEDLVTDQSVPPGGTFTVTWDHPDPVFMVYAKGEDDIGRFTEYKLVPWSVAIPHTDVNFDSGKAIIKSDEAIKVDEALAVAFHELMGLEKVNQAVGANLVAKLYIVGYTDTVGKAGDNNKLSDKRARAIAKYFHDKGFWAEIHYAGMGERGLKVQTPDNTDEVRNRRATYILGVQPPPAGGEIPSRFSKLADARPMPANFEPPPIPEKWAKEMDDRESSLKAGSGGSEPSASAGDDGYDDDAADDMSAGGGYDDGAGGDDGAPPEIEGEPGATKKGCRVDPHAPPAVGLGIVLLAGALRRRRR